MDDEQKWIKRIKRRQSKRDADLLVHRYYDEIYVFVYRQTGSKDDAMDLTQEIFISMLQSLLHYDPSKSSFRTWLYRVATNKVIDQRRRYRPAAICIDDIEAAAEVPFIQQMESKIILEQIDRFVSAKDMTTEQIFRLRLYQDMSFPEIAEVLAMPEATAKTRYHRLLQEIRKEFGNEYYHAE